MVRPRTDKFTAEPINHGRSQQIRVPEPRKTSIRSHSADHAVQIKQGAPVSDEVIKSFVEDKYFRFLSKPRDAASWDRLEAIVRENASGSAAEVNELEQCGITVCVLSNHCVVIEVSGGCGADTAPGHQRCVAKR